MESPVGPERPEDPCLSAPTRAFVSWHHGRSLVGCIGTLEAGRPLEDAVRHYAVQAALHDPRTSGVQHDELPDLWCEISVLSEPRSLPVTCLREIEKAIVPGRDGLILRQGPRRAVFLPLVWKTLPEPARFVHALCRKGGFDPVRDGDSLQADVFTTTILEELPLLPDAQPG